MAAPVGADALKARHPEVPVIGFPKGAGGKLPAYARETGVDAVGLDETIDPLWAARALPEGLPVQGKLDPLAVLFPAGSSADLYRSTQSHSADRVRSLQATVIGARPA